MRGGVRVTIESVSVVGEDVCESVSVCRVGYV